jgi:ABC-type cobalt transport system substrate-binding protein
MKNLLIVRPDNSIEKQELSHVDLSIKLASHTNQYDITDSLTMWVFTDDENAGYNPLANEIYTSHRGEIDSFFYGEVVFTGKSTFSEVFGLDADTESLVMNYAKKEN